MSYILWKVLHVLGVSLFLGNIITGLFWKAHADRLGDARGQWQALDGIIGSDRWFTVPGVVLITLSGVMMARLAQWPLLRTQWIGLSILLFALSGLIFALRVAPLQRRLRELARRAVEDRIWDAGAYRSLSRQWEIWGLIAILLPLGALLLMVLKPVSRS